MNENGKIPQTDIMQEELTAAAAEAPAAEVKPLVVNMLDARKKQIFICVLLGFFILSLILPYINPIPQVQSVNLDVQNRVQFTNMLQQSAFAKIFSKNSLFYRGAFELMISPGSISTYLMKTSNIWGAVSFAIYAALYALVAFIGLGVAGLIMSRKKEKHRKAIKFMTISSWGLIGCYAGMIVVFFTCNIGMSYRLIFGIPFFAVLGLVAAFVYKRQVFFFKWYVCPELVMKKELETASYYKNLTSAPCPHCNELVTETLESCPHCGKSLVERWKCRNCGQMNTPSRTQCYSCGHLPRK